VIVVKGQCGEEDAVRFGSRYVYRRKRLVLAIMRLQHQFRSVFFANGVVLVANIVVKCGDSRGDILTNRRTGIPWNVNAAPV
jgi:hypothetical protein